MLASANHKHVYIQYHMHSIASTCIDLPTILIHQLHNPGIVNHSSMHIIQPQIVLASAMHKHGYKQCHMKSIALTHIDLRSIHIHQLDNTCIGKHSSMHIIQSQIVLASAMHKHGYIQVHMHSIDSTHNDLPPVLIHKLDIPCIAFK